MAVTREDRVWGSVSARGSAWGLTSQQVPSLAAAITSSVSSAASLGDSSRPSYRCIDENRKERHGPGRSDHHPRIDENAPRVSRSTRMKMKHSSVHADNRLVRPSITRLQRHSTRYTQSLRSTGDSLRYSVLKVIASTSPTCSRHVH